MTFERATKHDNSIMLVFKIVLGKNPEKIKKVDLVISFSDGVSQSEIVNDFFCDMRRYVQAREQIKGG